MKEIVTLEKIVNLCKGRGFVYPGSDIYGGLANTWDYGPLGVELKNNIKRAWWQKFVQENDNSYGVDSAIFMNPRVWDASGHTTSFTDPLVDCKECKNRFRVDTLIENHSKGSVNPDTLSVEQMQEYLTDKAVNCPVCGKRNFTSVRQFNLMFETSRGVTQENQNKIYLRPETAQGEFVNFLNISRTTRAKIPFGIAQIGKAFRNEITPGNFIFRTIEFEQMEYQLFCKQQNAAEFYESYKQKAKNFLLSIGLKEENLMFKDHDKLAHYAAAATDIFFKFPMGWAELNGIHNRTDFDLKRHQEFSGKNMMYTDPITNEKFIPHIVEYSTGCDRLTLAVLTQAYYEENITNEDMRVVLKLHPVLAPYKVAILPLQKNALSDKAKEIYNQLRKHFMITYDETGSIGKRYRRQDEIGTPYCLTVDFETLDNNTVTLRDRDTMQQIRLNINDVKDYILKSLEF